MKVVLTCQLIDIDITEATEMDAEKGLFLYGLESIGAMPQTQRPSSSIVTGVVLSDTSLPCSRCEFLHKSM